MGLHEPHLQTSLRLYTLTQGESGGRGYNFKLKPHLSYESWAATSGNPADALRKVCSELVSTAS